MSRLVRSLAAVPLAVALGTGTAAAPASAGHLTGLGPGPSSIALPTGSRPEGIAAGPGTTFFAGARTDGTVHIGDARTGSLRTLVPGDGNGPAVGMLYDPFTRRLWVAGGGGNPQGEGPAAGPDVTAYDVRTGAVVFRAVTGAPGSAFLNDLTITRDAVYVTDSANPRLIVIPTPRRRLPTPGTFTTVPLTGAYEQPQGFGANGVRALPNGELVLVSGGVLYRVTTAGVAQVLPVRGKELSGGDGLVLSGRTLYVVNGYGGDEVAVLSLAPDYTSASAVGTLLDPELDRPTTAALIRNRLYVVNGRFQTLETTPDAPVSITRMTRF